MNDSVPMRGKMTSFQKRRFYRGVRILKNPIDLWNYQELFYENDIQWVIETGTHSGGSALYFADLLQIKKAEGIVITINIPYRANKGPLKENKAFHQHPKIRHLEGSSTDGQIVQEVKKLLFERKEPALLILDSNHSKEHVRGELGVYTPLLREGDYVIVEDTIVGGPLEAIQEFLKTNPDKLSWDKKRENTLGITFHPEGYYKVVR